MYGITHKVYGYKIHGMDSSSNNSEKIIKVFLEHYEDELIEYKEDCIKNGFDRGDEYSVLTDFLSEDDDLFWPYSGDDREGAFGIAIDEAAEFDSKEMRALFKDESVSSDLLNEYSEYLKKFPSDLVDKIILECGEPSIIYIHGTS